LSTPNASITTNGAVLLGDSFVCDAHARRPVRIVTHAHGDHLFGLATSLSACERVITTPITKELIAILKGWNRARRIEALDYGHPFETRGERITFYPAHHILGSAQVLLEARDGERILFTGDIKHPPAEVVPADILVIEATYGSPTYVRSFKDTVVSDLLELVRGALEESPVYIFGYHGKILEVVKILNESDVQVPIVVSDKISKMLKACQSHGEEFRNFYSSSSEEGARVLQSSCIGVFHVGAQRWMRDDVMQIILSGWQFDSSCKLIGKRKYQVALSDHSDFLELLDYVQKCDPGLVITDGARAGDASTLAREIKERLGIDAFALP
jgi:putative mRNA 3-end processing factor